jgi:DNA-binding CsgD family transcriptional regulator
MGGLPGVTGAMKGTMTSAAAHAWDGAASGSTSSATRDAVDAVLSRAGSEITLVDPAEGAGWLWPDELAERVTAAAARGCRTRVLFGRWPSAPRARQFARLAAEAGTEIRTGGTPEQAILTVDGVTALLPSDNRTVAVITQPGVVRTLSGFAEIAWSHAAAAPSAAQADADAVHRTMQQRIVALLADGAKDETIARALGMSVRTCRRHIADIMQRLDAVSRFQAGANAVRFGLAGSQPLPRS